MKQDACGLSVTTNSDVVVDAVNHFSHQIMSSGPDAGKIIAAADTHLDSLILQCYAAIFYLYAQEDNYTAKASNYLKQAETLLRGVTQRERLLYQATVAWQKLDYELAITILIAITNIDPKDCLAAKIAEWLFYCTGQYYQAHRFLNMCEPMAAHNKNNSYFMAIHSFALELSGNYQAAYDLAMKAIAIEPVTPWAHHTLAHVYLMTSKVSEGITTLEMFKSLWKNILPPLRAHNIWHIALFYLAELNQEKTKEIFTQMIWGNQPDSVLEQIDAIALLWRMEMADMPQNEKWIDIAKHLHQHPKEHYTPFNNAHFIYALARAGDKQGVAESLKKTTHYAVAQTGDNYKLWHNIALPLLNGCVAFANQDYPRASELLDTIMPNVFAVGGSDAQDELFVQMYFLSLMKSGQSMRAKNYFKERLHYYDKTQLGKYWFSQIN